MKLSRIEITYFRCFETLMVPLQPDVNVFVGVNASGKTAILDAIAIALYDIVAANGGGGKRQRAAQNTALLPLDIHISPTSTDAVMGRKAFVRRLFHRKLNFAVTTVNDHFRELLARGDMPA